MAWPAAYRTLACVSASHVIGLQHKRGAARLCLAPQMLKVLTCCLLLLPPAAGLLFALQSAPSLPLQDGRIDYTEFCAMMRQGNEDILKASSTLKKGILGVKQPRITS